MIHRHKKGWIIGFSLTALKPKLRGDIRKTYFRINLLTSPTSISGFGVFADNYKNRKIKLVSKQLAELKNKIDKINEVSLIVIIGYWSIEICWISRS